MSQRPAVRLSRIREVAGVFYDLGFGLWLNRLALAYLVPLRKRLFRRPGRPGIIPFPFDENAGIRPDQFPDRLRMALERLGGTYVKLGQMLSLRADLVTQPVADELRTLRDRVPPVPFEQIRAVVEHDLGKPLRRSFLKFDREPVGSASLAQVHRAELRNGKVVAVKVLRPGIEEAVRGDILVLLWFAILLEKHVPAARAYRPKQIVEEFREWTLRELNLANEAVNVEHFRKLHEGDAHVFIPAVDWTRTSRRVLTMEFSNGIRLDDFSSYRRLRCSRKAVAGIGAGILASQFFEHGFFHGDPHPGNFFVMANNVVCLHDFGIAGRIDEKTRRELVGSFADFLERDAEGAIAHVLHMARTDGRSDPDAFRRDVTPILDRWFYSPTAGERLSTAFYGVIAAGARHGISFPTGVVLLAKAIVTAESTALMLDPKFDMPETLRPLLKRVMAADLRPERLAKRGREVLLDAANLLDDAPEAARKLMRLAEREEIGIKVDTTDFDEIKREIDRQSDVRFLSLFLAADVLATAVLLHLEGVTKIAGVPLGSAGVIAGLVLAAIVTRRIRQRPT